MRALALGVFMTCLSSVAAFVPAQAGTPDDFSGSWRAVDRGAGSQRIHRLDIHAGYSNQYTVDVFGDCSGHECKLGTARGRLFDNEATNAREEDRAAILFKFERSHLSGDVLVRFARNGDILTHALLSFDNGPDIYRLGRFERSSEVGYEDEYEPGSRYRAN